MKKMLFLIIGCFLSSIAYSHTLPEWLGMKNDKKFFKKTQFTSGMIHIKKFAETQDQLPSLNKVGILGFSIYQPIKSKKVGFSIYTPFLTEDGAVNFSNTMFENALPAIKSAFADKGVQLLAPNQYLDTPEKQKLYDETHFKNSKTWKVVTAIIERHQTGNMKTHPSDLKYIMIANADAKIWRAVGKLAGDLGLDAFLIIENTFSYDGKVLALRKIDASLIGPNTIPYSDKNKKKYAPFGPLKGYLEGIVYGNLVSISPKGAVIFAKIKKKRFKENFFNDIGTLYKRISIKLLQDIEEEVKKLAKKIK